MELPIAWRRVYKAGRVLEVGNVLSNYYPVKHRILDKYDKGVGIIKQDAVTWRPKHKFDLVVSVSTVEHIGHEIDGNHAFKPLATVYNLLLYAVKPGGSLFLTYPWGYRKASDKLLAWLPWSWVGFLRKKSAKEWEQIPRRELYQIQYNHPFKKANAVVIGEIKR